MDHHPTKAHCFRACSGMSFTRTSIGNPFNSVQNQHTKVKDKRLMRSSELLIGASRWMLQTYHGTWSWRGEEGNGHLANGCLGPGVHRRTDGSMLPTVSGKASSYISDSDYSLCKTVFVLCDKVLQKYSYYTAAFISNLSMKQYSLKQCKQHSPQLTEGLVNIAVVWKQDLLLQQAFFYGRSGGNYF